ncbi:ShlB/FhaC/HecB family hemolysin secretion/activation protein [Leptolyngbya sp. AN03gr2]|uniref:ShlB/FhaC/HecB family hemolysin secretion/activation protein n=1 Tax=unclassified Leptolyngbya TaxID=2650499 RepID=UPI003D314E96
MSSKTPWTLGLLALAGIGLQTPAFANPAAVGKFTGDLSLEPLKLKDTEPKSPELSTLPAPKLPETTEVATGTFRVDRFEIEGSTRFKPEDFKTATAPYVGKDLTFAQLLEARSAITKLYIDQGYTTTGAMISPQTIEDGVVKVQVVEGTLEDIKVTGNHRLNPKYIRDRIKLGVGTPLNVSRLLENLQQLRLDPRISNVSADLQSGVRPGTNLLQVDVREADTFSIGTSFDNGRSPSVGSFRRKLELREGNLFGFGDALTVAYSNTRGSNTIDLNYTVPINARNGAAWLSYGSGRNNVIEEPFTVLDIQSRSRYYELGFRQPLIQRTSTDFAIGFLFSRQESQTALGLDNIGGFPLSPGADSEGRTRVSALRFFQEYTQRSTQHVFALRSQFSLGVNWLNATVNENAPDSRFFSWRGQAQWLRQVAPETVFLVRGDVQLSGDSMVPLEQFGLGGQVTVRGFRQDALLTDSGALMSAEFRFPIVRSRNLGTFQLAPFIDVGTGWNIGSDTPSSNTLVGAGLGLIWRQSDRVSVRLDWGLPLTSTSGEKRSLQERGLYFSVNYTPF